MSERSTIGVQRMPGFRFCLMLAASCPALLTPVVGLPSV
jgi:hypothetical protein